MNTTNEESTMTSNPYLLDQGAHRTAEDGRCAMEWVAYLAGEPHSDHPACVSAVLKAFCISLNDSLGDETRQRLRPYLARTIGTAGDGLDEHRAWLATDWLIREYTPAWLALAGLTADADRLRALPPVLAAESLKRSVLALGEAREHRAAARDAAWDAARAAAWAAAWAAARAAAWAAARAAAGDAAGAAAGAALAPTVERLQDSALDLLDRMLPTEIVSIPVVTDWREVCAVS